MIVDPQIDFISGSLPVPDAAEKIKNLADYVLGKFSKEDRVLMEEGYDLACEASALIMQGAIDQAMNEYNQKKKE